MTGWLVVDAMNVIGSRPDGWWHDRDGALRRLVGSLRRLATETAAEVVVVADGRPLADLPEGAPGTDGAGGPASVGVRYARRSGPDAADDRIVELLADAPAGTEVVTADRGLRERVEELGFACLGPHTLLRRLAEVADPPP